MAKFRKKPIVVEAHQFQNAATGGFGVRTEEDGRAYVMTIHGQKAYLSPGDWVIVEMDGFHCYPCKPDVFSATYEPFPATYEAV
jgi:hypothetical protein